MILRAEIAQRIFETPLLIHEGKLIAAMTAVGGRIVEGGIHFEGAIEAIDHIAFENGRPSLGRLGDRVGRQYDNAGRVPFDVVDNVAVIPIEGSLVHKGAYVGMSSGRTSYQGIQTQVTRARRAYANGQIKGAVFEVDSHGGEAAGAYETADAIHRMSQEMPTLAILTDFAFSGGLLLASAARQIVMPRMGGIGSIGAVTMHADLSRKLANDGITVTILAAGKHKAEGNPAQPLSDDARARILARLEEQRQMFAEVVGRNRGARFTKDAALATEAQSYTGADALALGMVDAIGSPNDAFEAFIAELNRKR